MQAIDLHLDKVESPYWVWDKKSSRYRNRADGRFLSQTNLERLQRRHIAAIASDIDQIGDLLLRGQISLSTFQEAAAKSIKTLWLHQYALGKGGIKQVTSTEWLAVGRQIKDQYAYFRQFMIDVDRGYSVGQDGQVIPMTIARFKARLSLYSQASRLSYETAVRQSHIEQGFQYAKRFLGNSHHCPECPAIAALGAVPIWQVIMPTQQCSCKARCKCYLKFYKTLEQAIAK